MHYTDVDFIGIPTIIVLVHRQHVYIMIAGKFKHMVNIH